MTFAKYVYWFLSIIAGYAVIAFISTQLDRIRIKWVKVLLFIAKFFAMFALAFELIADASPFLWRFAYPLMGIYIALFSDWACDIVLFLLSFRKKEQKKYMRAAVLAAIVFVYALYGTVNSQVIREDHLEFASGKLTKEHRFVFLSDLHYGSSQTQKSFEDALVKIRAIAPEFVILGGDICDEHTEKDEMEWVFEKFGELDMPVYYIYGNHDRQERGSYIGGQKYSEEELEKAILDSGIIILMDEYLQISDDIVLVGREDVSHLSRIALKDLPARPEGTYVIWNDHTPYQNDEILKAGADLQLSGHTHAGQIFPIRFLYTAVGLNVVYTYGFGSTDLYVSPGIGNWYYPFRNETHCSYTVIDLIPE